MFRLMNNSDDPFVQTNLRLPKPLREGLDQAAQKSRRTLLAEVTMRLEESLLREGIDPATGEPIGEESLAQVMANLSARLELVRGLLEKKPEG